MSQSEEVEREVRLEPRRVSLGPVEIKVTVMVESPDPGGADDDLPTKGGLGPRKKSIGMVAS